LSHVPQRLNLFFAILHPKVPLLGSAGGSKPCFWESPVLTFEGTTPLSSPSYPSLTPPPLKPCLFCLLCSSCTTFDIFGPPFAPAHVPF
jgi:hypothetical protein